MSETIEIQPYPINKEISYLKIFLDNFQLNAKEGVCSVYEYTSTDCLINVSRVPIPHEIYSEWGTNDDYIVEFVLDQLGFERKPDIPPIEFPE